MFKYLFEPMNIGSMEVKNRLVVPPMVTNYCTEDGQSTDKLKAYFAKRAEGGFGLLITANFAVTPNGRGWKFNGGIWEDSQIDKLKELTEAVHEKGSKIALQLYHAGRETTYDVLGCLPEAPSPIKDPVMPDIPRELTTEEVEAIVEAFGDAAVRAKKAGFDACEIHCAHGYLINTFVSPFSNKRTDKYGGNIWNRTRIAREIMENIKAKAGADFPVLARISTHELISGGLTIEDTKVFAKILENAGCDAIHASFGVFKSGNSIAATSFERHGAMTDYAEQIKKVVDIPVVGVGRINDPLLAESILASGKADFIAMGRGSLADPELPNKAKAMDFDNIIRCIGCRQGCSGRLFQNAPIGCTLNPLTGRELDFEIKLADVKKKIMVVGGGIAGMEAAIVAAKAGHEVTLYEKSDKLGGQWLLAAVPPHKEEMNAFTVWQKHQLSTLNVEVKYGTAVDEQLIAELKPDKVIVATGGVETKPQEYVADNDAYMLSEEVLSGKKVPGSRVAVIGSGSVAAETANHLAAHLHDVTLLIRRDELLVDYESAVTASLLEDLGVNGASVYTNAMVKDYTDGKLTAEINGETVGLGQVNTLVFAAGYEPVKDLAEIADVTVIGDAKRCRNGYNAVLEGYNAGLKI